MSATSVSPSQGQSDFSSLGKTPEDKKKLLDYWNKISELHQHEDKLLNSRLQAFLVTTAFLFAGSLQFRESDARSIFIRALLCGFGLALALLSWHVLHRTASAIEWYINDLVNVEQELFDLRLQPYATRRRLTLSLTQEGKPARRPVSRILGEWIPLIVVFLWVLTLIAIFVKGS